MAVSAYPTDINTVSSDIDDVGGLNATEWMIREDRLGKRYVLRQVDEEVSPYRAVGDVANKTFVMCDNNSSLPFGVNSTGNTIPSGGYAWIQVWGPALMETDGSVDEGEWVTAGSNGIGFGVTPVTSLDRYFLGFAMETDYGSNPYYANVFINPFSSKSST